MKNLQVYYINIDCLLLALCFMQIFRFVCSVCFSVHCGTLLPHATILCTVMSIVCFDSTQFDALLDNLSAFIVYVHML